MPTQCRLLPSDPVGQGEPGDMWLFEDRGNWNVSPQYRRDWQGKRGILFVVLPNGAEFSPDLCASGQSEGWDVTGEAPNITVKPSILVNAPPPLGRYHGFLTDGVLTDDIG